MKKCLRSVRGQSYPNIEVIVVDNYSSDGTREIAEKWGVKLYVLNAERGEAKNFGLKRATGKYFALLITIWN